jgi:arsenate reductase-like glutaredoxin family protein
MSKFYYEGVFYDNMDDFAKAIEQYTNSKISNVTVNRILEEMIVNIEINIDESPITNGEFRKLCSDFSLKFIEAFRNMKPTVS